MKVFLDTNVVIDFCGIREPYFHDAAMIIDMADKGEIDIIISALSFINIAYVLRKQYPKHVVMTKLNELMNLCYVSSIDQNVIRKALELQTKDFEDSVQFLSSADATADLIITRDKTGFSEFDVLVQTPRQFIEACTR